MTVIQRGAWHTLTVTRVWYCSQGERHNQRPDELALPCRDEDGWCTGHDAQDGQDRYADLDFDFEHPDDCERGNEPGCPTGDYVADGGNRGVPSAPGEYRVRAWLRPAADSFDDANAGFDVEPVGGVS